MSGPELAAEPLPRLLERLGVSVDPELYALALIHRSYSYENGQIPHNERLEFLGDAVLGLTVTDYLYQAFPDESEGRLAKLRAAVVSSVSLGDVGRQLGIGSMIKLGKGETATGGRNKTSIVADTVEALIGAMYLTSPDGARTFIRHLFVPLIQRAAALGAGLDWKTSLQEMCAAQGRELPVYMVEESGPAHLRQFTARARLGEREFAVGGGRSKKRAEQEAARLAFETLQGEDGEASVAVEAP